MRTFYFAKPIGSKNQWGLRHPKQREWHIMLGAHAWIIQFKNPKCKCMACTLKRLRVFVAKWFGMNLTDDDCIAGAALLGERHQDAVKQALTQERFRESLRNK